MGDPLEAESLVQGNGSWVGQGDAGVHTMNVLGLQELEQLLVQPGAGPARNHVRGEINAGFDRSLICRLRPEPAAAGKAHDLLVGQRDQDAVAPDMPWSANHSRRASIVIGSMSNVKWAAAT
jgi:hypothetical protein